MKYSASDVHTLLQACVQAGDPLAWEEFQRRYHKIIAVMILRLSRSFGSDSPELIDDLVQETYHKLCQDGCRLLRVARVVRSESMIALLKTVAHNVTLDHFRSLIAAKRGGNAPTIDLESVATRLSAGGMAQAGIEKEALVQETKTLAGDGNRARAERDRLHTVRGLVEVKLSKETDVRGALELWEMYRPGTGRSPGHPAFAQCLARLRHETLVTHAVLPAGIWAWVFNERGVRGRRLDITEAEVEQIARRLVWECSDPASLSAALIGDSGRLVDALIGPFRQEFRAAERLVLEPDGVWGSVPFAVLADDSGRPNSVLVSPLPSREHLRSRQRHVVLLITNRKRGSSPPTTSLYSCISSRRRKPGLRHW